jgi:hypothetical protein
VVSSISPITVFPERTGIIEPTFCGSVATYAAMAACAKVVVDASARYNKREKALHRCSIEGPNGVQRLTVPLQKPQEWHSTRIADVLVSTHGDWWHVHWGALEAAYGRTPFFEYYADDLRPWFSGKVEHLVDLDMGIHRFCLSVLDLPLDSHTLVEDSAELPADGVRITHSDIATPPYYQLWADRFGFTPDLSVLDLIFNLGPEAALYLRGCTRALVGGVDGHR